MARLLRLEFDGLYTQRFNRAHERVGHVFQGRYKAILMQKEAYCPELARYVVLNPVRARMARAPAERRKIPAGGDLREILQANRSWR